MPGLDVRDDPQQGDRVASRVEVGGVEPESRKGRSVADRSRKARSSASRASSSAGLASAASHFDGGQSFAIGLAGAEPGMSSSTLIRCGTIDRGRVLTAPADHPGDFLLVVQSRVEFDRQSKQGPFPCCSG